MDGYSSTSYGSHGGANGGGFVHGDNSSSQDKIRKEQDSSLRPVTVRQVLEATAHNEGTTSSFIIDGQTVKHVNLIAQVRTSSSQALRVQYKVEDGTGSIELTQWISSQSDKIKHEEGRLKVYEQNTYVKIYGTIKENAGRRYIATQYISEIEDHNEISAHFLETILVHLKLARGSAGGGSSSTKKKGDYEEDDKMDFENTNGASAETSAKLRRLSPTSRKIWEYIAKAPDGSEGVSVYDIASGLSIEINAVQRGCEDLLAEALLYTTKDDETFALLDG